MLVRLDPITLMKPSKSNVIWLKSHVMPIWHTSCDHSVGSNQDSADSKLYEFVWLCSRTPRQQVMPDDHSEVVPLLPIPNRTVKRLCADDSAGSRVKVGHRQALTQPPKPPRTLCTWGFGLYIRVSTTFVLMKKTCSDWRSLKNRCILQGFADRYRAERSGLRGLVGWGFWWRWSR